MKKWMMQHGMLVYKYMGIFIVVAFSLCMPNLLLADVGNNVDYSSGSGSSGSGSSSYSSGSAMGIDPYMIMWIIRYMIREPWILIPVIIVLIIIRLNNTKQRKIRMTSMQHERRAGNDFRGYDAAPVSHKETLKALEVADTAFSEQMMVSKVNNMFMRLQLAWMNKKWEEARPFENDALFGTHKMQLDQYIASGRTNKIEDIAILNTDILRYYAVGEFEYLDVCIKARFLDYVVEDETGRLIKGDKIRPVHMIYIWKLVRKKGILSNNDHVEATACPNCGANLSINQSGRCEYCDSIVTKGDFDWVLSEIEVVSQHK